ncbi:MAG: terpene cyclase/mutase family protein [Kiritimatiellae bacterium]|nr:terpene cyclase/mutase family protein [Kiritimatiellia bacterium]
MNDDKYTEKGFFRRLFEMFQGLRMPRDTREYKLARIELQRLSAPLTAIVVPTLFVIVLCVVTAVSSQKTELQPVHIADPIVDDPPPVDPPEPTPEDPPTPEPEVEITVDVPTPAPFTPLPPTPINTSSTDLSVKPASIDAVMNIKSPVMMKTIKGSRTPGTIGTVTSGKSQGGGDPRTEAAVMKVLWWLKAHQNTDGSWGNANKVANTALAVLTYLAHGEYPGNPLSPYTRDFGPTVQAALDYLIGSIYVGKDNLPHFQGTDGNEYSFLIGTYALCEAFAMTKNPNCKEAAQQCLYRIIENQSSTGGWDYKLNKNSTRDDLSFAGWAIQALKAGKMAGLHHEGMQTAINKAVNCLKRRGYSKSGGFTYTPTANNNGGNTGLAGVGTLAMQFLGRGTEAEALNALDVMRDWVPAFEADKLSAKRPGGSPQYYCYYATQCKYQAGMKPGATKQDVDSWVKWNLEMRKLYPASIIDLPEKVADVKGKEHAQGYYQNTDAHSSRPYMDTCLAALQLMVYYRYLPTTSTKAGESDAGENDGVKGFDSSKDVPVVVSL